MKFIDILCKRSVPQLKQSRWCRAIRCPCRSTLTRVLSSHAALVEYTSISGRTLQQSIESEMSGGLEGLLLAIGESGHPGRARAARETWRFTSALFFSVKCVNGVPAFFAELLYKSMKVNVQLVTTCDNM